MGYHIRIGNAHVVSDEEDFSAEFNVTGSPVERIGYCQYHKLLELTSLEQVLCNDELYHEAKTIMKITPSMLQAVEKSIKEHKQEHPDAIPEMEGGLTPNKILYFLEYFRYWMEWALKNSELPAIRMA